MASPHRSKQGRRARRDVAPPPSGAATLGKNLKALGGPGTVGLEIVVGLMLGLFAGQYLDARLAMAPLFTLLGVGLGLGAGVRGLVRAHRSMQREAREDEALHGNPAPAFPYDDEARRRGRDDELDDEPSTEPGTEPGASPSEASSAGEQRPDGDEPEARAPSTPKPGSAKPESSP